MIGRFRANRALRSGGAAVAVTALFATWFALGLGGSAMTTWIDDVGTALAALLAASMCFRAYRRASPVDRRFWLLLTAASVAWTIAEGIWGVYELVLRIEVPVPSWADAGYLSAIPLVVLSLLAHPGMRGTWTRRVRTTLDGLVVATSLFFLSWTVVLGSLVRQSDLSDFGHVVALGYPFGDAVIVFFVILVARRMTHGQWFVPGLLLSGLLAMALTDTVYAYLTQTGGYTDGGPIDAGWIAAYLGIAAAAHCSGRGVQASGYTSSITARPRLAPVVVPFIPVLAALSVIAIETKFGGSVDRVGIIAAFVLVVLVLARQALLMRDLTEPVPTRGRTRLERLRAAFVEGEE